MRRSRDKQHVGLYCVPRCWQNPVALDGLLSGEPRPFHELQPFLDTARLFAVAIVIDDALAPGDAKRGVFAAGQNRRVLDGNMRLVIVAIQSPSLQLPASELAFVHEQVKWMLVVIALFANGMESRDKFLFVERLFVLAVIHKEMLRPSWAISKPASSTARCSGESSSRTGFVLLMWMRILRPRALAGNCASNPSAPESG